MVIYNNIKFGTLDLEVTSLSPSRVPKTTKQVIGSELAEIRIIGNPNKQWELDIRGVITGTGIDTKRTALEALDNTAPHAYIDGKHDGTYYLVPGSLSFEDNSDLVHSSFRYSMKLIEQ